MFPQGSTQYDALGHVWDDGTLPVPAYDTVVRIADDNDGDLPVGGEDVRYEHEAVRGAAVVGVPDGYRGQTVSETDLIAFTKERMAAYKYPRQIEFLDEVPKTVTGKVLRRELRSQQKA